jgi:hypothetical protein
MGMSGEYVAHYATAVLPVYAWVMSSDWRETYTSHFDDFYGEVAELIEAPIGDILGELPTLFYGRAIRCVFDDFLTAEFESTPRNALDQYLDEVGMDLAGADVDFLIAFRRSFMRVYHVVDRTPEGSVVLREVSGGDTPIQIEDEVLTAGLSPGDKIATRIVTVNGKTYLAGSILVLDDRLLVEFEQAFEVSFKEAMRNAQKYLRNKPHHRNAVRQQLIKEAGPVLSSMWLMRVLATFEHFRLAKEDDPETVFQGIIPFDSELEPILECLDAHPDLERPIPQEFVWAWRTSREDPEASLKALIWLAGSDIVLESCERSRLQEAAESLSGLLGDAAGEVTIEEVGGDDETDEDGEPLVPMPMSDEEKSAYREHLHNYLDHQFRELLDIPVTELNGRIPRELAKTAKGRKQLSDWLTMVETQLRASENPLTLDYDFGWMWQELGIEAHRQSSLFG